MDSVLITGAAGFIGSRLLEISALQNSYTLIAVDALLEGNYPRQVKLQRWHELKSKLKNVTFLEIDLLDKEKLHQIPKVEYIINCAAVAGLDFSWTRLDLYSSNNIVAVHNLCDWAIKNEVRRFVHASTSSVYGKVAIGEEGQVLQPVSPYGISKMAGEQILRACFSESNVNYTILRYFSVYGPNQRPDMAFAKFIESLYLNQELHVTGDLSSSRSNTFVDDVVNATLGIIEKHSEHANEIYNVAGLENITLENAIELIASRLGRQPIINLHKKRLGDQLHTSGDTSKIRKLGLMEDLTPFQVGIERQIEAFLNSNKRTKFSEQKL